MVSHFCHALRGKPLSGLIVQQCWIDGVLSSEVNILYVKLSEECWQKVFYDDEECEWTIQPSEITPIAGTQLGD